MGNELLTLALVNHAIVHGFGYNEAWPLAESIVAEHGDESVRDLADRVRLHVVDALYKV